MVPSFARIYGQLLHTARHDPDKGMCGFRYIHDGYNTAGREQKRTHGTAPSPGLRVPLLHPGVVSCAVSQQQRHEQENKTHVVIACSSRLSSVFRQHQSSHRDTHTIYRRQARSLSGT